MKIRYSENDRNVPEGEMLIIIFVMLYLQCETSKITILLLLNAVNKFYKDTRIKNLYARHMFLQL